MQTSKIRVDYEAHGRARVWWRETWGYCENWICLGLVLQEYGGLWRAHPAVQPKYCGAEVYFQRNWCTHNRAQEAVDALVVRRSA